MDVYCYCACFLCVVEGQIEPLFFKKKGKGRRKPKKKYLLYTYIHTSFSCVILSDSYARALRYRCA